MWKIGQFSRMTKVTVKALRFYEDEGLLEPESVDCANNYRYYSTGQLPRIHRIVALRQCGFSIPEIKEALKGGDLSALFAERRKELESRANEIRFQLSSTIHYLDVMGKGDAMTYDTVLRELPEALVFSKRMTVESYDSYFTEIPRVGEEMEAANPGLACPETPYCFIIYHDGEYRERDIDIEYCEEVSEAGTETETIKFKRVGRVDTAACVLHKGPYSELPLAYAAVYRWIEDNGFECADNARESYIDGIWNKESELDWLTEVQVPVRKSDKRGIFS